MLEEQLFGDNPRGANKGGEWASYGTVLRELSIYLFEIRGIPKSYCREVAREHGINDNQLSDTHLKQVVKNCPRNRHRAQTLLLVLLLVKQKLEKFTEPLRYSEAVKNVGLTLRNMTSNGWTIHALSDKLGINYGSLKNLHDAKSSRPRECPWALNADLLHLQRLQEMKAQGLNREDMPQETQEAIEEATARKLRRLRLKKEFVIYPFDGCASCQAPWSKLVRKGDEDDTVIMQCTVCECENLVDTGEGNRLDDANTHEIIQPGDPCWMCDADYADLQFHGIDNFKMDVYSCSKCSATNRVAREDFLSRRDEEEMSHGDLTR